VPSKLIERERFVHLGMGVFPPLIFSSLSILCALFRPSYVLAFVGCLFAYPVKLLTCNDMLAIYLDFFEFYVGESDLIANQYMLIVQLFFTAFREGIDAH
jgi:hypothetical protein